jgi:hypothetical protein
MKRGQAFPSPGHIDCLATILGFRGFMTPNPVHVAISGEPKRRTRFFEDTRHGILQTKVQTSMAVQRHPQVFALR